MLRPKIYCKAAAVPGGAAQDKAVCAGLRMPIASSMHHSSTRAPCSLWHEFLRWSYASAWGGVSGGLLAAIAREVVSYLAFIVCPEVCICFSAPAMSCSKAVCRLLGGPSPSSPAPQPVDGATELFHSEMLVRGVVCCLHHPPTPFSCLLHRIIES